jgi:hypothetical protein
MELRGLIIVLMLLGVMTLEAKPKYRIETWVQNGTRYYLPERTEWYRTNYFYLPFKIWRAGSYPFQYKSQAEDIIQNWKDDYQAKRDYRRSEFIEVN